MSNIDFLVADVMQLLSNAKLTFSQQMQQIFENKYLAPGLIRSSTSHFFNIFWIMNDTQIRIASNNNQNLYLGVQNIAVEVSSQDPFFRLNYYYGIVSRSVDRNVDTHHQLL